MSKDQISRRTFVKGLAAGAAGMVTLGALQFVDKKASGGTGEGVSPAPAPSVPPVTESEAATAVAEAVGSAGNLTYTPGTYTASARGISSDVGVTMTFTENSITDVQIDVSGETENIGAVIGDEMGQKILDKQGVEVDAVSGATVTSDAIKTAAADCIRQASGVDVTAGKREEGSSADWLGEEPQIEENAVKDTIDCEVLVIGAGSSGTFAAASAVEEGAKTILVEKFAHDMASGIRDTLAGCGSREQLADGDDVDKEVAVRHLCSWSQGYTRRSLARLWADKSGETMDWFADRLEEGGSSFRHEIDNHELPSNYEFLDVGHSVQYGEDYYEQLTMDIILDYATKLGLEVHYEITMVKLEKENDRVVGIIAQNGAGDYVRYRASKGVIIATGGYGNNADMMAALQPHTLDQICVNYNKAGAKGDGIKACLWAGAIMDTTHTSMIFDRGAIKPDEAGECGKSLPGAMFWMGSQPFLKVNLKGERFMSEYQPYDYILHSAASQPHHTYCTIWDSNYAADIERFATHGCSRLYPHENGTDPVFPMGMIVDMNAGLEADGYIVKADTIEELAEKLHIPADTFAATVKRYNELADKGVDEDFGKESYRMSKLEAAPFYGVRQCGGYFICTMDGIQIDDNMHAVNEQYEPIEGLYVIGDCSGNYFSGSYPNLMGGAAAGRSATFGRLAGQNAAHGI